MLDHNDHRKGRERPVRLSFEVRTHVYLGPSALWLSVRYHLEGYPASLSAFLVSPVRDADISRDLQTCHIGEMFTGNILYQPHGSYRVEM